MSWTYDAAQLSTSTAVGRRYVVRLNIGDTITADQQLQDEEIDFYLTQAGDSIRGATISALKALIAEYSRQSDLWIGHTRVARSTRARAYRQLLETIETSMSDLAPEFFAGGQTISGKATLAADTDAVQPAFKVGMDDIEKQVVDPWQCP